MNLFDEEGRKTGPWEEADAHGGTVSGHYLAGERTGLWQHRFADGAVRSEFHYDTGELNGDAIWYRQTGGPLQKGGFLNGEKHGRWQRWTATGAPLDEGTFDRGVKSGVWTSFAPDGSITKTVNHRTRG